jgi:hypothetical protein
MKKLLVLTMILSLASIPKIVAQAAGFLVFNDVQNISPDSITGSFAFLTSSNDTDNKNPDFKVTATINGTSYDGTISVGSKHNYDYKVSYPIQENNTDILITVSDGLGGKITETYNLSYQIFYDINVESENVQQTKVTGTIEYSEFGSIGDVDPSGYTVSAKIGDETYNGTVSDGEFTITYPKQDLNTSVVIYVVDKYGYSNSSKTVKIANHPIQLSVNSLDYSSNYVTGTTEANAKVTATIKSKTYKATAKSNGSYKIKIPAQKSDTKITVKSTNKTGYYNTKSVTVSNPNCLLDSSQQLLESTSKVTGSVTGALNGDYIIVKVGNKTYKKTLKAAKKQNYAISVKNLKIGQYITVSLYNKHGQIRNWYKSEVYYATKVKLGMTKYQVLHTAYYGSPDSVIKSTVAGMKCEQWGYYFGSKLVYLWFQNGVLTSIDQY